jgi:hypothetical protein
VVVLLCSYSSIAGSKYKRSYLASSEVEMMEHVLTCLKYKDSIGYFNLFMPFDTLWKLVLTSNNRSPEALKELANLRTHPTILIDMDPMYNKQIMARFSYVVRKGEDSGLQWGGVVMQRFELQQHGVPRDKEGLQHIMPERFKGFLFVRDVLSSTTWCITITEIQKVNGFYFGGQVLNVLEASDIDQYFAKDDGEQRYLASLRRKAAEPAMNEPPPNDSFSRQPTPVSDSLFFDSTRTVGNGATDSSKWRKALLNSPGGVGEDDGNKMRLEVIDRRYYKGKFDDEIEAELYIRYMRDGNGKVTNWDALYKFGDLLKYVKMDVTKDKDGVWIFEEPVATMELELANKSYSGSWTNGSSQTGFDVELKQAELSQKKAFELDYILENKTWGKTSDQSMVKKEEDTEDTKDTKRKRRRRNRADMSPEGGDKKKDNNGETTKARPKKHNDDDE